MNRVKLIFIALLVALIVPVGMMMLKRGEESRGKSLLFYCAAGVREPVEKIAARYEEEYGVKVNLQFGGSGTLLGNIEASGKGDLYLAADSSYTEQARRKGLALEAIPLSWITAGLIVPMGNPKGLDSLSDLADHDGLRIVLGNPETASIGKFTKEMLIKANLWDTIEERVLAMKPTVSELASDVEIGAADVAIVWDVVAAQYSDKLEFVHVPEFDAKKKNVTVCVLESAEDPAAALHFARYLGVRDRGLEIFQKHHFEIMKHGSKWEL